MSEYASLPRAEKRAVLHGTVVQRLRACAEWCAGFDNNDPAQCNAALASHAQAARIASLVRAKEGDTH